MCSKKGNNKGLSLVELIVAVAILAIIVLPLLRSFMVSSETNMKAKKQQRALELAQNIMEEIEVSDLQGLAKEFDYPGTSNLFGTDSMQELTKQASGYEPVKKTQPGLTASIEKDGSKYTFVGQDSKKYYFALKNIKADGKDYDALITLSGVEEDGTIKSANEKDMASIYKMDQNHDAISLAKQTPQTVFNTLSSMYPELVWRDITRIITVDITKNAASQVTQVKVSYAYQFQAGGTTVTYTGSPADPASYEDVVFDNAEDTSRVLNNIYLFYYPWYTSTVGNKTDKIIIKNEDSVDAAFVLVKQEEGQAGLQSLEDNYSVDISLYEPLGAGTSNTNLSIRTNLDVNLATGNATVGKQGNYILVSNGISYTNASARMGVRELTDQAPSDRLFDVTVEVYEPGSYDANFNDGSEVIVSITGGMVN